MLTTGAPTVNFRDLVHGGSMVIGPAGKPLYDLLK
jgi:hypothetical protein